MDDYYIRSATQADVPAALALIEQARAYFRDADIDQWQDGYPNSDMLLADVRAQSSYVLCSDERVVGTWMFAVGHEPTYDEIVGAWHTQGAYGMLHRIAIAPDQKGHGLAGRAVAFCVQQAQLAGATALRGDTHTDNHSMQHMFAKNGFLPCGVITLETGAKRLAFDKVL